MDAIDDIKAGFVTLLEQIPDLAPTASAIGKVHPELNDEYYNTYPSVALIVGDQDVKLHTHLPLSNEFIADNTDPLNPIVGRELTRNAYPVKVLIRAARPDQKRDLANKILTQVLNVRAQNGDPGYPTGVYELPSGVRASIQFHSSEDWEDGNGEKHDGKKWRKVWVREITFTVIAAFVAIDSQPTPIVNELDVTLYVNTDGLSEDNGETINIV